MSLTRPSHRPTEGRIRDRTRALRARSSGNIRCPQARDADQPSDGFETHAVTGNGCERLRGHSRRLHECRYWCHSLTDRLSDQPVTASDMRIVGTLVVTVWLGLACRGQPTRAASFESELVEARKFGPADSRRATALAAIGERARLAGKLGEAQVIQREVLSLRQSSLPPDDPNIGVALHDLAIIAIERDELDEAQRLLDEAFPILERAAKGESPEFATALNTQGLLYKARREYAEAERSLRRSIEIRRKVLGSNNLLVGGAVGNLGLVMALINHDDEAEKLFADAQQIFDANRGAETLEAAQVIYDLALLRAVRHRYAEAEPLFRKVLKVREEKLGKVHASVAQVLSMLGEVYVRQSRDEEAETALAAATSTFRVLYQDRLVPASSFADALSAHARVLRRLGRNTDAEKVEARAGTVLRGE